MLPLRDKELRPSGSHIWHHCQGSVELQRYYPNESSEASEVGTAVHWISEQCLSSHDYNVARFLGTMAPNNVVITQEMVDGAEMYIMDVLKYANDNGLLRSLQIEKTMAIDGIYKGMKGTPDCWVYNPATMELVIWDLKFGYGIVNVYQNPQFLCYLTGIMDILKIDGITDQMITVVFRVVQPRSYVKEGPIREWRAKASDMRGYINQIKMSAEIAMSDQSVCTPGKHCRYCTGKSGCEGLQRTSQDIMDATGMSIPLELKGAELGFELKLLRRNAEILKYRLESIEAQVEAELRAGHLVNGYAVEDTYGRKRWKKGIDEQQVIMMGQLMGVDITTIKLDTPAQVIKKLKGDDVVKQYIERPHNGWKVVEDDGAKAKQAFAKKTG